MGIRWALKRPENDVRTDIARVPRFLNPLGWISIRSSAFLQFLQWSSLEMVARSTVKFRSDGWGPFGRMDFPDFALFLVLDLVF